MQAIEASEGKNIEPEDSAGSRQDSSSFLSRARLRAVIPHLVFVLAYAVMFAAYQISNKTEWAGVLPSICVFAYLLISFDAVSPYTHRIAVKTATSLQPDCSPAR